MDSGIKSYLAVRLLSAFIFGGAIACFMYDDYIGWSARGKDAWLLHEAEMFEQHIAHPTIVHAAIVGVLAVGVVLACELLAQGIKAVFDSIFCRGG